MPKDEIGEAEKRWKKRTLFITHSRRRLPLLTIALAITLILVGLYALTHNQSGLNLPELTSSLSALVPVT